MAIAQFHATCKKLNSATDERLGGYYVKTPAIQALADFTSEPGLAVGLKGIGKTAAYRYLAEFDARNPETPDITIGITADKYSLYLPHTNLHYSACLKQFRHDLILEALKAATETSGQLKTRIGTSLISDARKHVNSYAEMLRKIVKTFSGFSVSVLGSGFTLPAGTAAVAVGLRPDAAVEKALGTLKAICASGIKIRIVVDDPEHVFSASRDLDVHLVGGFCLAALELSESIPNLKVIALLKTHVYYPILLYVDDLSRHPDHMGRLCWEKDQLLKVVEDRLRWSDSTWADVFDGGESNGRALVEFMCERIRNGPRDLLRWLDLTFQLTAGGKVSKVAVNKTRKRMSLDSLAELESAHSESYPRLGAILKIVFHDGYDRKFTLQELRKHIGALKLKDEELMSLWNLPWMQRETSFTLPDVFFKVGTIALHPTEQAVLPYQGDYHVRTFESSSHVSLIPSLVEALQ
jgi:hypothetical protein